jgi:hypothetical protein
MAKTVVCRRGLVQGGGAAPRYPLTTMIGARQATAESRPARRYRATTERFREYIVFTSRNYLYGPHLIGS